ncbi:MAG: hypothetical protein KatS3mg067_0354 [Thermosynechococcus sp.]|uniref:hypothetical protein n=1 Tax=Thermosynechococcus sp. TaxID=2814275 RepID=UPI002208CC03|nr:hypothetical protein [Thermosynechococcus sp.]BCX11416.1 MAG: hypothetical protein KatS3mg067_0354 [Thermosynechococcus sp.]
MTTMSNVSPGTLLLSLSTAPFLALLCLGRGLWRLGLFLSAASPEMLRGDRLPLVEQDET